MPRADKAYLIFLVIFLVAMLVWLTATNGVLYAIAVFGYCISIVVAFEVVKWVFTKIFKD